MVGIVVVTHGKMAEGMVNAVEMIMGEQQKLTSVGLFESEAVEDLMEKINSSLTALNTDDGVLLLADLPGASPFNASARLAMADETIEVVSGVNLPMLAEVLVLRDGMTLTELVELATTSGFAGIKTLDQILNRS